MFLAPAIATGLAGAAGSSILSALGFKNGGKVKKNGLYMLHKGEVVVPSSIVNAKGGKPTRVKVNKKGVATEIGNKLKTTRTGRGGKKGGRGNRGK
tara:strand:+ start:2878 stop:3165 length:288 start_codon:yes stop_codon:yes gene_type:complete